MTVTTFTIPALTVPFKYKGAEYQIPLPEVRVKCYSTDHLRKVADGLEAYDEYSRDYLCHHLADRGATFEAIEDALRLEHDSHSLEALVWQIIEDQGAVWGGDNNGARPIRIQWAKHMAAHIRNHLEEY